MKTYPYIEERDYKDRTEFRVVDKTKNDGVHYVSYWGGNYDNPDLLDYFYNAYKKNSKLKMLFVGDYKAQRKRAIENCRLCIKAILKHNEKPKIKRFV